MNGCPQLLAIGQTKVLRALQEAARHEPTVDWVSVLTALGMLVLLLSVGYAFHLRRSRHGQAPRDPGKLFRTTLAQLDLTSDDRRLLRAIARHSGLAQPASMLVSPIMMAQWAHQWVHQQPSAARREAALTRLDSLSRRLFNEPLPTPEHIRPDQPSGSA